MKCFPYVVSRAWNATSPNPPYASPTHERGASREDVNVGRSDTRTVYYMNAGQLAIARDIMTESEERCDGAESLMRVGEGIMRSGCEGDGADVSWQPWNRA